MDVTRLLEADHRQVEALFDKIDKAEGAARSPLLDELVQALQGHMELEEAVLYPAMGRVTGEDAVDEAETEHELGRKAIEDVMQLAPDAPGFGAALAAARAGIEHHVEDEEGEVFPELRKDATLLDEIATPFMQRRLQLGLPISPDGLAAASTKDELLAEAQSAGIQRASSMTKEQLAEALTSVMASG